MARRATPPKAETATLNVRPIHAEAARRIKEAARARGWTAGEYLAKVTTLHDEIRALHDKGLLDRRVALLLEGLGLQTVRH